MSIGTPVRSLCWAAGIALSAGLATAAAAQLEQPAFSYASGQDLYEHICQGCHMPGGTGAAGAGIYPALANNPRLRAPIYPVLVILRGQKAMPAFSELSDAQVAAVTNYIRSSFGNAGPGQVTAAQVQDQRSRARTQKALAPG
jgi:mono/diheme cytochrome c family protein